MHSKLYSYMHIALSISRHKFDTCIHRTRHRYFGAHPRTTSLCLVLYLFKRRFSLLPSIRTAFRRPLILFEILKPIMYRWSDPWPWRRTGSRPGTGSSPPNPKRSAPAWRISSEQVRVNMTAKVETYFREVYTLLTKVYIVGKRPPCFFCSSLAFFLKFLCFLFCANLQPIWPTQCTVHMYTNSSGILENLWGLGTE